MICGELGWDRLRTVPGYVKFGKVRKIEIQVSRLLARNKIKFSRDTNQSQ